MKISTKAVAAVVVMVALGAGCAWRQNVPLTGTDRATGADGMLTLRERDSGNLLLNLEAAHLPPPARVNEEATVFVVWAQPPDATPVRLGALSYDEGARTGTMDATTTYRAFDVVVTAETALDVAAPSEFVVFRGSMAAPR